MSRREARHPAQHATPSTERTTAKPCRWHRKDPLLSATQHRAACAQLVCLMISDAGRLFGAVANRRLTISMTFHTQIIRRRKQLHIRQMQRLQASLMPCDQCRCATAAAAHQSFKSSCRWAICACPERLVLCENGCTSQTELEPRGDCACRPPGITQPSAR